MERRNLPDLSEEELNELSLGLLREWWVAATQAFVDTAGSETALRRLKPHFLHSGRAGQQIFARSIGIPDLAQYGINTFKRVQGCTYASVMDGVWGPTYDADDGSGLGVLRGCATKGACKEVCMACEWGSCYSEDIDPSYQVTLTRSLSRGDDSCHWLVSKRGAIPKVKPTDEFLTPTHQYIKPELFPGKEVLYSLGHAYLGEFWVMTTKAFVEEVGSEKAMSRLASYMRHSGMSLATHLTKSSNTLDKSHELIVNIVTNIQHLHQMDGTVRRATNIIESTLTACPFSGSPPEMCLQYEAFFNGVCEAIDPTYEFSYDRMMSKGDKTCHWVIRKKGAKGVETTTGAYRSDDPVKTLTMRFANGEITEDELENKIGHLKKLGLIK